MEFLIGDATNPIGDGPKIIAHVCNDVGAWGAGFTGALDRRWKQPGIMYRAWAKGRLVGPVPTFALGNVQVLDVEPDLYVANMVAQHDTRWWNNRMPLRYDALETCLRKVVQWEERELLPNFTMHMPRIGCGLAGGKWEEVEPIVRRVVCPAMRVFVYNLP